MRTALYDVHVAAKGKMVLFAGVDLPVWYTSIREEHVAVRQSAGMFDISHMGLLQLRGSDAQKTLQRLSCNDVTKTHSGKMVYSMLLNQEGGILDDVMMGKANDGYWVVVNAANKANIMAWFSDHLLGDTRLGDGNEGHSFLAIQGPLAVEKVSLVVGAFLREVPRFGLFEFVLDGQNCMGMRTGYTGEDGCELRIPNTLVQRVWQGCLDQEIVPCGLGARDTLRLEVGLPLYGQELTQDLTPLCTRYSWVVDWGHYFCGKEALLLQKETGIPWTTVGLSMTEKVIPRSQYALQEGGHITSGTLSPSLDYPIAMALVKPAYATLGTTVHVMIRDMACKATVVKIPFEERTS